MKNKLFQYDKIIFAGICCLLMQFNLRAQKEDGKEWIPQHVQQYNEKTFQEKVYVHTDKEFYLAGETIWFKLYDVDGYRHLPFDATKVAYVEIITKDLKPVLQAKIAIDSGVGSGSFKIPFSVNSGIYRLRAYTNWMKNFSADFYYEQGITVINTLKSVPVDNKTGRSLYSVQFFPEGGNLVDGLGSKIAVKVTDQNGTGIECSGTILNQRNDTITSFKTQHAGMGNFFLTPHKNETYYGVLQINNSVITKKIPDAYPHGYIMNVSDDENYKSIKVTVRSSENLSASLVYLIAHTRGSIKNVQQNNLQDGEIVFSIDKKNLGDGISELTVFNSDRQPVCDRLYFKQPEKEMFITIKKDQENYQNRKKVNIDLSTSDQSGNISGNLSLAVILLDSLQHIPENNIVNYLLLSSDLKGRIESPQYYFDTANKDAKEAIDNLMLTQGWSRFKWEEVLQNKTPSFDFLPEIEGPIINATISDKKTGHPVSQATTYLSVPGNYFKLGAAISTSAGSLRFNMKNIYGKNEIILQTNNYHDSSYRVDIINPFSDKFSSCLIPDLIASENWKTELLQRSIYVQADNSYLKEKKQHFLPVEISDTTSFYGQPTFHYNLDDYTRFVTMEEVMREYVTDVRVRKENNKFNFRVRNLLFNTFFENDPLLLIDGVPSYDATKIIGFDPLKIKSIDVISHRFYKGAVINDGIVSYKTYNGDLAGYQLDPGAIVLEYDGLQQQKEFYSPSYEKDNQLENRIPDFRNVLFWLPQIKTDDNGKRAVSFYTSDLKGKFAILVQGITAQGLPGSSVAFFSVE
ncbi:MAG: hypothetical protein JST96_00885 [Bacteroidetes bacterium]|nr:hypothetical protein [Bacteroidota bacterium]